MNSEAELCRILKHCTWNENSLICPEKYRQEKIQKQRDKSAVFLKIVRSGFKIPDRVREQGAGR
jgi:hypothetical protein